MEGAMVMALCDEVERSPALINDAQRNAVKNLWRQLITYTIYKTKQGFDEAIRGCNGDKMWKLIPSESKRDFRGLWSQIFCNKDTDTY